MDDDDKTEQTNWSMHFDLKNHETKVLEDEFGFEINRDKNQVESSTKSGKGGSWLKKVIQQMSGDDQSWGVRCEFCGQYETEYEKIEKQGINQLPVCRNCLNIDH